MQDVVIDKPYSFFLPRRASFWPWAFSPLLRPYLSRVWRVTQVQFVGVERLRQAIRERASVLLVPNHCRPNDPMIVGLLGAEAGTPVYIMASWHLFMGSRPQAWFLTRIGAFSFALRQSAQASTALAPPDGRMSSRGSWSRSS
jgi:1-acyl-sn-glycerol-3-phosphate acyltransferase